jgi:hypothetical protein
LRFAQRNGDGLFTIRKGVVKKGKNNPTKRSVIVPLLQSYNIYITSVFYNNAKVGCLTMGSVAELRRRFARFTHLLGSRSIKESLRVNDVLNKNIGFNCCTSLNYIEDRKNAIIRR